MNETERQSYNRNYFEKVLKPKRQAAAAEKKKQKAAKREAEELEQARTASLKAIEESKEHNESQALATAKLRAIEREHRAACIAVEFPDLAPDEILEDGTTYYSHLFQWVEEYLTNVRTALAHYDFGAFYNALSMEPAGQALLRYAGIEPLAGACWKNFTHVNLNDGKGCFKTLVNTPENIAEIESQWNERWARPKGEVA